MKDFHYKFYCKLHFCAKFLLRKTKKNTYRFVSVCSEHFSDSNKVLINGGFVNEFQINKPTNIEKDELFPTENIVEIDSNHYLKDSFIKNNNSKISLGVNLMNGISFWENFIDNSIIPEGYKFSGLLYTGFISSNIDQWCLPSWLWTNAATVRLYCNQGNIERATCLGVLLKKRQLDCGGWIVRNDYNSKGSIPVLAPNDSAYIANNAFIELYRVTKNIEYLNVAIKCADWIMETAREDGLVWTGYDFKNKKWLKDHIIVDTGFTAALFANLVEITNNPKYKIFLKKFTDQYIKLFYNEPKNGFATSLNFENKQNGGMFARGQAWALEGLIPTYKVLKTERIAKVIDETISNIIKNQSKDGGWPYNFSKPFLGQDCKGVAVIAKNLMDWNGLKPNKLIVNSSKKALEWSANHTANQGEAKGGIFSFCMEGAVVHNLYTSTAFVYTSAYAIELHNALNKK
jgi:rhamnogalacturonyl hydrolase YesR